MKLDAVVKSFREAVFDTDRDVALRVVRNAVEQGVSPEEIVFEVVVPLVEQPADIGGEGHELSLAQHFMTGLIASQVIGEMLPKFRQAPAFIGRMVIGNAQGDLHTLGKRIVRSEEHTSE